MITNYYGMCLDVLGGSAANFTPVQVHSCNSTAAQKWTIVAADRTVRALGKCLDVEGGGTAQRTRIDLYTCNGTGAQRWFFEDQGRMYNPQSNQRLTDGATDPGVQAVIEICDPALQHGQQWTRIPATVG